MVWEAPSHCPVGHELVPPRVTRGWTPCQCAAAMAHKPDHNPAGHDYVRCWIKGCGREIREHGCDRLDADHRPIPEPREPWAQFG